MKRFGLATLLLVASACSMSTTTSAPSGGGAASGQLSPDAYVVLNAPTKVQSINYTNHSFNIKGTMTNQGFYPLSQVEGDGKFCPDGKDWLSLSDLTVHSASEGKSPRAPYVLGCVANGVFRPASRDVVVQ